MSEKVSDSGRQAAGLILLVAVLAGGVFWMVDSALQAFVFGRSSFADAAFRAEPYSLYHRLLVLVMAMGIGLVAEFLIRKRRRVQEEHDRLFELASEPLCVLDDHGHFSQVNPAWKKVLGWSQEDLVGREWLELVHPDDKEGARVAQKDFTRGESVEDLELRMKGADGEFRWILLAASGGGKGDQTYAVAHDITRRKMAENTLASAREQIERKYKDRSEELYQAYHQLEGSEQLHTGILANVSVALLVTRGEDSIEMVNDEFCTLTGYTRTELNEKTSVWELVAGEDREGVKEHHQECLAEHRKAAEIHQFRLVDSDGNVKPVVARVSAVSETDLLVYTVLPAR